MFRISEFSRFTRVTVKTLRHYDRLGILTPAFVDPDTRYRYYSARQVEDLQRIVALRELGFSLEHVAGMLDEKPRGRTLEHLLEMRRAEVERRLEEDRQRLAHLDARLAELRDGQRASLPNAVLHDLPAVKVAARRARVADLEGAVEKLFEAVEADAARAHMRAAGPPILIYHDRDHRETNADVEAAVPVLTDARRAGRSTIRMLPAVPRAACVVYSGSYDRWTDVMRGLLAWLGTRRLVPAGPTREVFLQFAARDAQALDLPREYLAERADDFVTEMQIPVRSWKGRRPVRAPEPG